MRPGKPTSAGTSNASTARMNTSIASAMIEGSDSRMVTRRIVCQTPAPCTRAASSSSGFELRSVALTKQERQRRPQEAFDQHHAGHRIDIDDDVGVAGERPVEMIDRSGFAEEQQPGGDVEDVGRAERDDRGEIGERLERRVGALDDPRRHPPDQQRQRRARRREHQRVDRGGDDVPALQHRLEIAEAPGGAARRRPGDGEAALHQEQERRHDQRQQDHDQQRRHDRRLMRRQAGPAWRNSRECSPRIDTRDVGRRGHGTRFLPVVIAAILQATGAACQRSIDPG